MGYSLCGFVSVYLDGANLGFFRPKGTAKRFVGEVKKIAQNTQFF